MNSNYDQQMTEMGGVYLRDHLGVEEWAFKRDDALKSLGNWRKKRIPCKGGDVIVDEGRKFRYTHDNWHCQSEEYATKEEYIEGSIAKAEDYIRIYPESEGGKYYYVLV